MNTKSQKPGWFSCLLEYARGSRGKLAVSALLSVVSVASGLLPYYCVFRMIDGFAAGRLSASAVGSWCGLALLAYAVKVVFFGLSTGLSHYAAYHILEKLRLRVTDRFLHAPLGEVEAHSIGEIKGIMVDKIEDIEPPLAHMIPEGGRTYCASGGQPAGTGGNRLAGGAGLPGDSAPLSGLHGADLPNQRKKF